MAASTHDFLDVIANRIIAYTGDPHGDDVRAYLEYSGQDLARRMSELTLEPLRRHAEAADGADRESAQAAYADVRYRLIQHVSLALSRRFRSDAVSQLQRGQHGRAEGERIFAEMLDHVQPVAVRLGEPHALALEQDRRARTAIRIVNGVSGPSERDGSLAYSLGQQFLPRAEKLAEAMKADDRAPTMNSALKDYADSLTNRLRLLAGDHHTQPDARAEEERLRRSKPVAAPNETLRDGIAIAYADVRAEEIVAALELPEPVADGMSRLRRPRRWEGEMADGFADAIAGVRPEYIADEVLDRLKAADRGNGGPAQWDRAAQLLVGSRDDAADLAPKVSAAMRTEYQRQYGLLRRDPQFGETAIPSRPAAQIGAAIVSAGVEQITSADKIHHERETSLHTAVAAALLPASGRGGDVGAASARAGDADGAARTEAGRVTRIRPGAASDRGGPDR